jgi:hypothetical protein
MTDTPKIQQPQRPATYLDADQLTATLLTSAILGPATDVVWNSETGRLELVREPILPRD